MKPEGCIAGIDVRPSAARVFQGGAHVRLLRK